MPDSAERRRSLTFLIVGGGYAGTELCAQMVRVAHRLLPRFPNVAADDLHFLLVDVAKAVMPELGSQLGDDALALLKGRGVDVRLGTSIKEVDGARTTLTDGTVLERATVIWCAGVTANPLVSELGLPTDHGKLAVTSELNVGGHDELYAIGDAAAVPDLTKPPGEDGRPPICPPTAQPAMRQAPAAARNIAASLGYGTAKPYRHHDLGLVVDLGGPAAAATPLGVHMNGRLAKLVTRGYHLYALPSFERRLRVAVEWAFAARNVTDSVAFGLVSPENALITRAEGHQEAGAGRS